MSYQRFALPFAGLALAVAGVAGFTGAGVAQQTRPPATADQAMMAAQVAQVAIATYQMDNAGLHDLDEATAAGRIPAGALGKVRRTRIVAQATQWPESIQPKINEFVEHAMKLEDALKAEDARAAAPDAAEVHDLGHEISDAAYNWLSGMSGGAGGADHHDDDHE